MEKLRLEIENFRAIKKASIGLNGITVLTGENGCGKSTISKLYYYYIKNNLEYKQLLYSEFHSELTSFISTLSDLLDDLNDSNEAPDGDHYASFEDLWELNHSEDDSLEESERFFFEILSGAKNELKEKEEVDVDVTRLRTILLNDIVSDDLTTEKAQEIRDIENLFQVIAAYFQGKFMRVNTQLQRRDATFFKTRMLQDMRLTSVFPTLFELEVPVLSHDESKLNNIYTVDKLFYIDTPMAFPLQGIPSLTFTKHWRELNRALGKTNSFELDEKADALDQTIGTVINGKVIEEKVGLRNLLQYKRADGLLVDLRESATGIRAFAILELLLTKGLLNNKTLLLIDEPEAHLHPQWIVEYARIIIALNKQIGVKFLLASHSPDMISALRYISEREGTLDQLNFYLAGKDENSYQYIYKHLGTEIDEIFGSFNIAMERISLYGV